LDIFELEDNEFRLTFPKCCIFHSTF